VSVEERVAGERPWRVLKFGGTSVAGVPALRALIDRVREARLEARPVVVVSALAGVTDQLVALYSQATDRERQGVDRSALVEIRERHRVLLDELAPGDAVARGEIDARVAELEGRLAWLGEHAPSAGGRDEILAGGERLSAPLVAAVLRAHDLPAVAVDAAELLITDGHFGDAEVDLPASSLCAPDRLKEMGDRVAVLGGFYGRAGKAGESVALLGRGGSDTSATSLGAAIDAERVDIFTDVDGIHSADPRWAPAARRLPSLSIDEAADLAFFGAKVLHRKCLTALRFRERALPLRVASTHGGEPGETWIGPAPGDASGLVRGITIARGVASVSIEAGKAGGARADQNPSAALGAQLMRLLRDLRAPVYHLVWSGSGPGATVVLPEASAREVFVERFEGEGLESARITVRAGLAVVAAVGSSIAWGGGEIAEQFRRVVGGAGGYGAVFGEAFPNVLLAVVDEGQATRVARAVHRRFVEEVAPPAALAAPVAAPSPPRRGLAIAAGGAR
jgi:aspartate kinase